jgi:hypothetical protein
VTDEKEALIGYRHPPRHTQFKPGQSGNSRGRASESHKVGDGAQVGKRDADTAKAQQMGSFEIMLRTLVHRALRNDDLAAVKEVLRVCEEYKVIKPPGVRGGGGDGH